MRGIYAITNTISDTVYYGQSVKVEDRLNGHKCALRKGVHENPRLQHSYNKYGQAAFVFSPFYIIEDTKIDLTPIEKNCIKEAYFLGLKVFNIREPELKNRLSEDTKYKMSLAKVGNNYSLGRKHSEDQNEKLRLRMLGKKYALGWIPSEETKEKIRAANRGRQLSEETRKKISSGLKGRISPRKGKKCSEETRKKISENTKKQWLIEGMKERLSEAHKGKKLSEETKKKISEQMKSSRSKTKTAYYKEK